MSDSKIGNGAKNFLARGLDKLGVSPRQKPTAQTTGDGTKDTVQKTVDRSAPRPDASVPHAPRPAPPSVAAVATRSTLSSLPDIQGKVSPLFRAAYDGNLAALRREVYAGAGVNQRSEDPHFPTALFIAVAMDHVDCVAFLLAQGADVEARAPKEGAYWTALMCAVSSYIRPTRSIALLLEAGANVHAEGMRGNSPLKEAGPQSRLGDEKKELYTLLKKYDVPANKRQTTATGH